MIRRLTLILPAFFLLTLAVAQTGPAEKYLAYEIEAFAPGSSPHRLTIFLIPSKVKYDWSSPRALQNSLYKNYVKTILRKERYLLGHAFIALETPLYDETILTGMRASTRDEQTRMVMEDYYGLSILGADLKGRLEKAEDLFQKVDKYSGKGQIGFMTLLINAAAAERMLEFLRVFSSGDDTIYSPCYHYGGAYWPRYHDEGAGCSAFAVAFLDLGGLMRTAFEEWKIRVNIPEDLMGGPYNEGNRVRMSDIRKRRHWADSTMAYEPFEIYDPTIMYDWVREHWNDTAAVPGLPSKPVMIHQARGMLIDARGVPAPVDEPVFIERENPSVFVK